MGMDDGFGLRRITGPDDIADGLAALSLSDPRLGPIIDMAGPVPLRRGPPGFAGLAEVIVGQMVSKASAAAIWARLSPADAPLTAERMMVLDDGASRAAGLSQAKVRALKGVASACLGGSLDLEAVCAQSADAAIRHLTGIPGVGPWTAEVYLLVHGGHPDIFPAGDVALRAALGRGLFGEGAARPGIAETQALAAAWAPWRSVAARLFWAYYARQVRPSGGIAVAG